MNTYQRWWQIWPSFPISIVVNWHPFDNFALRLFFENMNCQHESHALWRAQDTWERLSCFLGFNLRWTECFQVYLFLVRPMSGSHLVSSWLCIYNVCTLHTCDLWPYKIEAMCLSHLVKLQGHLPLQDGSLWQIVTYMQEFIVSRNIIASI